MTAATSTNASSVRDDQVLFERARERFDAVELVDELEDLEGGADLTLAEVHRAVERLDRGTRIDAGVQPSAVGAAQLHDDPLDPLRRTDDRVRDHERAPAGATDVEVLRCSHGPRNVSARQHLRLISGAT
jgi:hypothetical protein